jgi:hypothetical protein
MESLVTGQIVASLVAWLFSLSVPFCGDELSLKKPKPSP